MVNCFREIIRSPPPLVKDGLGKDLIAPTKLQINYESTNYSLRSLYGICNICSQFVIPKWEIKYFRRNRELNIESPIKVLIINKYFYG